MLVTAVLVQWCPLAALWLHAVLALGALAWAVREFGFDWWQPALRGAVIIVIGFRLLKPWLGDTRRRKRSACFPRRDAEPKSRGYRRQCPEPAPAARPLATISS